MNTKAIIYRGVFALRPSFLWAWMDVKLKYRRSMLGPFWQTINTAVIILCISYITSTVFNSDTLSNIPYVGLGIISWAMIAAYVSTSTDTFIQHRDLIRDTNMPISLFIGRAVFRVFIMSLHNLILYFIALPFLPITFNWYAPLAIIGIAFMLVNGFWLAGVLGFLCARFRDLEMVIHNLMQLVFFITPVFWDYKTIQSDRMFIVEYNPLFYFIEMIRAPLLGQAVPLHFYGIALGITVVGYLLTYGIYRTFRRHLPYYV